MGAGALMTATVHSNFNYQLDVYNKLESLLEQGSVDGAKKLVEEQKDHMEYMIENAESFCERESCTAETKAYLERAFENSNQ